MESKLRALAGEDKMEVHGAWLAEQYEKKRKERVDEFGDDSADDREPTEKEIMLQEKLPPKMDPENLAKYVDPIRQWKSTDESHIPSWKKELLPEVGFLIYT